MVMMTFYFEKELNNWQVSKQQKNFNKIRNENGCSKFEISGFLKQSHGLFANKSRSIFH